MKSTSYFLILLFIPGLIVSCNYFAPRQGEQKPLPAAGVIHKRVICNIDSSLSYALFIPGSEEETRKNSEQGKESLQRLLPCIIAIDPHADGLLPVSQYKDLAARYGYVLMGSNNLKNGMPPPEIDSIVATLFREAKEYYPVDTSRIYLMGFSGGARIAALSGLYKIPVKGVISCGAGLAGASGAPVYKIDYYSLTGMSDFNMNEIVELEYPLSQAGLRFVISTFDGIHAWPPADEMEGAFQWFSLNAMKDGLLPVNDTLVTSVLKSLDTKTDNYVASGRFLDAAGTCKSAISFANGLTNTDEEAALLGTLEKDPRFGQQKEFRKKLMTEEEAERKMLMEAIVNKDLAWWNNYVRGKRLNFRNEENPGSRFRNKMDMAAWQSMEKSFRDDRIVAFVQLLAYMNATSVLTSRNEEAQKKIITIYEIVDPENSEPYYLQAILAARRSDSLAAIKQLNISIDKGFNDKLRLTSQEDFASLKEMPAFFDLVQRIK